MNAVYNKWYKCQKGTMPEDFENVYTKDVVVCNTNNGHSWFALSIDCRTTDANNDWKWFFSNTKRVAWMLPEPYKD